MSRFESAMNRLSDFFVVYRFTFAVAWNRRAERLAAQTADVGAA